MEKTLTNTPPYEQALTFDRNKHLKQNQAEGTANCNCLVIKRRESIRWWGQTQTEEDKKPNVMICFSEEVLCAHSTNNA